MRFKPLLGVMTECSHAPEPNKRLHSEKTPRFPNQTAYFNPYSEPIVSTQFTDVRDSNTGLNGFWILGQVLGFQSLSMEPLNYDYQWVSGLLELHSGFQNPGIRILLPQEPDPTSKSFPGRNSFRNTFRLTTRRPLGEQSEPFQAHPAQLQLMDESRAPGICGGLFSISISTGSQRHSTSSPTSHDRHLVEESVESSNVACSADVFWAGESCLFMFVLL